MSYNCLNFKENWVYGAFEEALDLSRLPTLANEPWLFWLLSLIDNIFEFAPLILSLLTKPFVTGEIFLSEFADFLPVFDSTKIGVGAFCTFS